MNRNKKLEAKRKKAKQRNARRAEYRSRPHECGECRACCYAFPLQDKPRRTWCKHSTPQGCACYKTRPSVCSNFECLYLGEESAPPFWRPDRSGIIITQRGEFRGHPILAFAECWDDALKDVIGQHIFRAFSRGNAILLCPIPNGLDVYCSHTGLVLDAEGQEELRRYVASTSAKMQADVDSEPFDFGGNEQRHCCSPEREPSDSRTANLTQLVAGQAT